MTISKTQETNDKRNGILSSHELNEVIRSYKNADAAGDTYERDRLFVIILDSNRKLIYKVMQSRYPSFIRAYGEDMMQFCATELFKILPNYDAEKGVFSTYFTPSIIHACQQFVNELNGYTAHYGAQIYKIKSILRKQKHLIGRRQHLTLLMQPKFQFIPLKNALRFLMHRRFFRLIQQAT